MPESVSTPAAASYEPVTPATGAGRARTSALPLANPLIAIVAPAIVGFNSSRGEIELRCVAGASNAVQRLVAYYLLSARKMNPDAIPVFIPHRFNETDFLTEAQRDSIFPELVGERIHNFSVDEG